MKINFLSFFVLCFCLAFVSCQNELESIDQTDVREQLASVSTAATQATSPATISEKIPSGPITNIEFAESTFDYGDINDGDKVNHTFTFTNTGDEPLIISNAKGSCGCTVPDWPKTPIPVGGTGEIQVVFNAKGKGSIDGKADSKKVTITANTEPAQTFITIKGKIFKQESAAASS